MTNQKPKQYGYSDNPNCHVFDKENQFLTKNFTTMNNNIEMYAKIVEEFDNIENQVPEKGGALCICTENDSCVIFKHGSSLEIIQAMAEAAINDERIYQLLSAAVGIARMKRFIYC